MHTTDNRPNAADDPLNRLTARVLDWLAAREPDAQTARRYAVSGPDDAYADGLLAVRRPDGTIHAVTVCATLTSPAPLASALPQNPVERLAAWWRNRSGRPQPLPHAIVARAVACPADERWIALPNRTWSKMSRAERDALQGEAARHNIGLLALTSSGRIHLHLNAFTPPTAAAPPSDPLAAYPQGDALRAMLGSAV